MAPHGEAIFSSAFTPTNNINNVMIKTRRTSNDGLKRTTSDMSYELLTKEPGNNHLENAATLTPIPEIEDAKCECCGMVEEYTLDYIGGVRGKYRGNWICGLCAEAVEGETEKKGGKREAALEAHMTTCSRFNKFGRAYPVLSQAEAMRDKFRRCVSMDGRKIKDATKRKGQISRSSSCIPAIYNQQGDQPF